MHRCFVELAIDTEAYFKDEVYANWYRYATKCPEIISSSINLEHPDFITFPPMAVIDHKITEPIKMKKLWHISVGGGGDGGRIEFEEYIPYKIFRTHCIAREQISFDTEKIKVCELKDPEITTCKYEKDILSCKTFWEWLRSLIY